MRIVSIDEAKIDLLRLIEQACGGEEIVIARDDLPLVGLVPLHSEEPRRQRGSLEGQVVVPDSFFDPMLPRDLDAWGQ